jgi:hypothetical protein
MNRLLLWNKEQFSNLLKAQLKETDVVYTAANLKEKLATGKYEVVIILCELLFNQYDQPARRQEMTGIAIAREVRLTQPKLLAPFIFVSFLPFKKLVEGRADRELLRAVGHHFLQLPATPGEFRKLFKSIKPLSELELADIRYNALRPDGIISAQLHQLPGLILRAEHTGLQVIKQELVSFLQIMHDAFHKNPHAVLQEFRTEFAQINAGNLKPAIERVSKTAEELIKAYKKDISGFDPSENQPERPWLLLLLDDELGEDSLLVRLLKKKGVTTACRRTAKDAMVVLAKDDKYRGKITVILTDYRLNEKNADEVTVQQPTQGYTFLNQVAGRFQSTLLSAVVYSGMPRQFLFDTVRGLGLRTEFYSKKDFAIDDERALNHLADRIVEIGERNFEALEALPLGNVSWQEIQPTYQSYRSLPNYEELERGHCDFCTTWISSFREGITPPTPMVKGEYFADKKNLSEKEQMDRFTAYYRTRRLAQYLYLLLEKPGKSDETRETVASILKPSYTPGKGQKLTDRFFSQTLALSLLEFPASCTIEELCWLEYDMDYQVLAGYQGFRANLRANEALLGGFISESSALKKALTTSGFCYKPDKDGPLYFREENYTPVLFDKKDLGKALKWLDGNTHLLNKEEFKSLFDLFHKLRSKWMSTGGKTI